MSCKLVLFQTENAYNAYNKVNILNLLDIFTTLFIYLQFFSFESNFAISFCLKSIVKFQILIRN